MLDGFNFESCFDDLVSGFSDEKVLTFLSYLFPIKNNDLKEVSSFEKLIYNKGNQEEIYTKNERSIINKINEFNICSEFYMYEGKRRVLCRLIAIDMSFSSSIIYDSVAIMKICNKALDGFNIYTLVCSDAVYLGCDMLGGENKTACLISYPINNKINWDSLLYVFSDVSEDKSFLKYYYALLNALLTIFVCYENNEEVYDKISCHYTDDDEHWYNPSDATLYRNEQEFVDELYDSLLLFEDEVKYAKKELDFIKSNRVNSLEMLFEAEKHEENSLETHKSNDMLKFEKDEYSEELHSLLSNPDELIKVLKNKRMEETM